MSRKTNLKAYRLGYATWWQSRTAPQFKRDHTLEITDSLVTGIFQKFRYLLSEPIIQRKIDNSGNLILLGNHWNNLGSAKSYKSAKAAKSAAAFHKQLNTYSISYLNNLLKTYLLLNYKISFRQVIKLNRDSDLLTAYLLYNSKPIINVAKRILHRVKQEARVLSLTPQMIKAKARKKSLKRLERKKRKKSLVRKLL